MQYNVTKWIKLCQLYNAGAKIKNCFTMNIILLRSVPDWTGSSSESWFRLGSVLVWVNRTWTWLDWILRNRFILWLKRLVKLKLHLCSASPRGYNYVANFWPDKIHGPVTPHRFCWNGTQKKECNRKHLEIMIPYRILMTGSGNSNWRRRSQLDFDANSP